MNLQDLKKEIDFKWRVQSSTQYGANCVAYIDSRQVQDLLDEVMGVGDWQCKFEEHKNNMFCSIGINVNWGTNMEGDAKPNWVWKSDCGTESQVEKQKGEASDAFKRAAVMWGIGRFLYSKKIIKLPVKDNGKGKFLPYSAKTSKFVYGDDISKWCNLLSK
tara:strand:+ start:55 stop:537 length:483 start_codon:yes stop_codon:yes gene_type:complete